MALPLHYQPYCSAVICHCTLFALGYCDVLVLPIYLVLLSVCEYHCLVMAAYVQPHGADVMLFGMGLDTPVFDPHVCPLTMVIVMLVQSGYCWHMYSMSST